MKESWPFCDCLKGTSMGEVTLANWPLVVILVSRDNRESTGLVFLGIVCVCVCLFSQQWFYGLFHKLPFPATSCWCPRSVWFLRFLCLRTKKSEVGKLRSAGLSFSCSAPPLPVPTTMFCLWPQNTSGIWGSKGELPLDTEVWIHLSEYPSGHQGMNTSTGRSNPPR